MTEPRADRWIRLYDLGVILRKTHTDLQGLSRRVLRQRVYRIVRTAESFHERRFTKLWRGRLYVSVNALDEIKPPDDQRLGQIEINQVDARTKIARLERQSNSHGARIRNLEKWRELTQQYMADVAALECAENDSKLHTRSG
jgi:hypothetical protein